MAEPSDLASCNVKFCHDCGTTFELKESDGPCAKCVKLSFYDRGSKDYNEIQTWLQCQYCGVTFRNLSTATCGLSTCKELHEKKDYGSQRIPLQQTSRASEYPIANTELIHTQSAVRHNNGDARPSSQLAEQMAARLKRNSVAAGFHPPLNTERLDAFKSNSTTSNALENRSMSIEWQLRFSSHAKTIDSRFGKGNLSFSTDDHIEDIKERILNNLNISWAHHHPVAFQIDEIELRFPDNRLFESSEDGSKLTTLKELVAMYCQGWRNDVYHLTQNQKASGKRKSLSSGAPMTIHLEVFVHEDKFNNRVDPQSLQQPSKRKKRKVSGADLELASSLSSQMSKRSRFTGESMFNPNQSVVTQTTETIIGQKLCIDVSLDGEVSIVNDGTQLSFVVHEKPFATGRMKQVHKARLLESSETSSSYVLKRFFRIQDQPASDGLPGVADFNDVMQMEAIRIAQGQYFLKMFKDECQKFGVDVHKDIQFTDVFLLQETIQSKISGADELEPEGFENYMWLVEPLRPKATVKYSSTLTHQCNRTDKVGSTLNAFVHFAYEYSQEQIVFADLQGTSTQCNGKKTEILFDPMTHTQHRNNILPGIGDFGKEGIRMFLEQHICNTFCQQLELCSLGCNDESDTEELFPIVRSKKRGRKSASTAQRRAPTRARQRSRELSVDGVANDPQSGENGDEEEHNVDSPQE